MLERPSYQTIKPGRRSLGEATLCFPRVAIMLVEKTGGLGERICNADLFAMRKGTEEAGSREDEQECKLLWEPLYGASMSSLVPWLPMRSQGYHQIGNVSGLESSQC